MQALLGDSDLDGAAVQAPSRRPETSGPTATLTKRDQPGMRRRAEPSYGAEDAARLGLTAEQIGMICAASPLP